MNIKPHIGSFLGAFLGASMVLAFSNSDMFKKEVILKQITSIKSDECPSNSKYLSTLNGKKVCELKGLYTQDLKLTSDFYWALNGEVVIGGDKQQSATLEIEAGTTIYGSHGPDYLLISRGSKIMAEGTKLLPIVFTSAQDVVGRADESDRGQWGGLVIAGNAPTNAGLEESFEFSKIGRKFGGSRSDDNSGVLKYVVVKYAGFEVALDKELNGISFGGVGSKTVVDYVQVYNNADDGIELWGGTVNLRHIVLVGNADDALDLDHGYQGNIQYLYVKQNDVISYDPRGIEADNQKNDFKALPMTSASIANFELHGSSQGETGVMLRRGAKVDLVNGLVDGFGRHCLSLRNRATLDNTSSFHSVKMRDCSKGLFGAKSHIKASEVQALFLEDKLNSVSKQIPDAVNVQAYMNDNFFDEASFIGAYDRNNDWRKGWTVGL
jgi:trimeric autotransporter adhesin